MLSYFILLYFLTLENSDCLKHFTCNSRLGSIHGFFDVKLFAHALVYEKAAIFVENDRFFLFTSTFRCCFDTIIKKIANKNIVFKLSLQKLRVFNDKIVYKDGQQQ